MQRIDAKELIKQYKFQLIFLIFGFILVAIGLISKLPKNNSNIEVLSDTAAPISEVVVDVSGAVKNSGVYHLTFGSRVDDAINIAGGILDNADKNWLDKNLDRAAKLIDGQKLFIPFIQQSESATATNLGATSNVAQYNLASNIDTISINSASLNELMSLQGIGQIYGQKIIDQRPYSSIEELISKKVLKQSTFDKIKDKISL